MTPARVGFHASFVVLAVLLCGLQATVDDGGRRPAVALATLVPLGVILVQLARRTTSNRRAWWAAAIGLLQLTLLNLIFLLGLTSPASTTPVTAGLMLGGYAAILAGALFATIPVIRRDAGGLTDAMIVGLGAASVLWTAVLSAPLTSFGTEPTLRVYYLAIVLLVSAMLGAMARAFAVAREARTATSYVIAATTFTYLGNIGATLTPPGGAQPWWVVHCWILAYLSLGAAFGHPSGQRLGVEVTGTGALTARRLVFLGAALGLNPLLAAALVVVGGEPDPLLLAVGSLAVTPLVLHRIMLLARMHASAEQRLRRLATHDELTGLPNRRAAIARLDAILDGLAAGTSPGAAVLFLDLDEFKQVNDGYGHQMGDRLLVEVARRLRGAIRSTDLVARFGGDEFVLVLEGDPDAARSAGVASVEHVLEPPVLLDGLLASARASIGTTELRTGDRLTAEEVLAAADTAMYRVKWSRRERDAEPGRRSSGSLA